MVTGKTVGYFSGLNRTMEKIIKTLLSRDAFCKMLFYDDNNPLAQPSLTTEQKDSLLINKISNIPTFPFEDYKGSFIIVAFDTFNINDTNPKFIDQTFGLSLYSHKDLWRMDNGQLRPFVMLDEIHQALEDSNMFGIGKVKFIGGSVSVLSSEMMGYVVTYKNVDFDRFEKRG